jgi:hypothetical protein
MQHQIQHSRMIKTVESEHMWHESDIYFTFLWQHSLTHSEVNYNKTSVRIAPNQDLHVSGVHYQVQVSNISMKLRTSWEANSNSAGQEIPQLLWDPKAHHCVHKSPPLDPTLSQMNSVHTFPPYFPEIHSNIILPSMSRFSKWFLC